MNGGFIMWKKLNKLAKEQNISIRELARISGVAYTTIRDTQFRDIGFTKAAKLAEALGVSLDDLKE